MSQRRAAGLNLNDPQVRTELSELRELMAICLERMDALHLGEVSPHLDLALARFDERVAGRDCRSPPPDSLQ